MTHERKKVLFVTGTRADFGKLKPLIQVVEDDPTRDCHVFVTGMHTLSLYGSTYIEVQNANFENTHVFMNQHIGEKMELVLANTISGLSRYVHEINPDMLVVHGDRVEALAGAIVGSITNTLVAHVEGGERSGTIDELIRHSVSKLSHIHFVANDEAKNRLLQMGEFASSIFVIGSPDIDAMKSKTLPSFKAAKEKYDIAFDQYGVVLFHPVTTDVENLPIHARNFVDSLLNSNENYIVIYPNNDEGSKYILREYERLEEIERFRVFPSINFEHFLVLLKHSRFIIGNSSAGIREAPVYRLPSINVGDRQNNRYLAPSIVNTSYCPEDIASAIEDVCQRANYRSLSIVEDGVEDDYFGSGNSANAFKSCLAKSSLWRIPNQKVFNDLSFGLQTQMGRQ